jgi:hypothetical protein
MVTGFFTKVIEKNLDNVLLIEQICLVSLLNLVKNMDKLVGYKFCIQDKCSEMLWSGRNSDLFDGDMYPEYLKELLETLHFLILLWRQSYSGTHNPDDWSFVWFV